MWKSLFVVVCSLVWLLLCGQDTVEQIPFLLLSWWPWPLWEFSGDVLRWYYLDFLEDSHSLQLCKCGVFSISGTLLDCGWTILLHMEILLTSQIVNYPLFPFLGDLLLLLLMNNHEILRLTKRQDPEGEIPGNFILLWNHYCISEMERRIWMKIQAGSREKGEMDCILRL